MEQVFFVMNCDYGFSMAAFISVKEGKRTPSPRVRLPLSLPRYGYGSYRVQMLASQRSCMSTTLQQ